MTTFGSTVSLAGELRALENLMIEGRIEGPVICEGFSVTVAASGEVTGGVIGRDVTVFGRVVGQIVATDVVDLRPGCVVKGDVVSPRFILDPAARFDGRVEPQHLEAALRVARYQQKKRDAGLVPAGGVEAPAAFR